MMQKPLLQYFLETIKKIQEEGCIGNSRINNLSDKY